MSGAVERLERLRRATHAYVGTKECGCHVALVVDLGDAPTRRSVSEFMQDGLTIGRHEIEETRTMIDYCRCSDADPSQMELLEDAS